VPTEAPATVATELASLAAEWAEAVRAVDAVWAARRPRADPGDAPAVTGLAGLRTETGPARPAAELLASDGGDDDDGDVARLREPPGPAAPAEELVFASDDDEAGAAATDHVDAPKLSREERIRLRREREVRAAPACQRCRVVAGSRRRRLCDPCGGGRRQELERLERAKARSTLELMSELVSVLQQQGLHKRPN